VAPLRKENDNDVLKYMRDDDIKDWKKLIKPDHIDKATKYIRWLSLALHLAFVCTYMQSQRE
jgi:hypothetical protein